MSEKVYLPRHSTHPVHAPAAHAAPPRSARLADAIRRNPARARRTAASAAIAAGALVFGLAEAGADEPPQKPRPIAAPASSERGVDVADLVFEDSASGSSALSSKPIHVKHKVPATKAVITGLAANGIPKVALNAYRVAAARVSHADPGCGIDWPLLAAIGRVESDHGRFAGAQLNPDGTSTPRILGPALDGTNSDYIPAPPDGAARYGDGEYAHALGAMQFIPSTWDSYGSDGNGDGKRDVFNINDAALAAARYLCAAGGNLRTPDGLTRAIMAYNHNDAYLAMVVALARAYRTGVPVTGVPVGNLTGPLPPLGHITSPPPVNPGDPTALQNSPRHQVRASAARPAPKPSAQAASTPPSSSSGTTAPASAPPSAPAPSQTPTPTPTPAPVLSAIKLPNLLPAPTTTTSAPASTTSAPALTLTCTTLMHQLHLC